MSTATAWGCDLGTNMSCAAIWKDGHVEVVANAQGNRITPSYVAFGSDGERLVGDAAKNQAPTNPLRTVYDAKRLIGRKFSDPEVQEDIKMFPFKVINDGKDKPQIEIDTTGSGDIKRFYPEEISAMVLGYMKEQVEAFMGKEMKDVVITVPAYFSDAARRATVDAAMIAGLNCLRIINEPTAAALAYGLDKKGKGEQNVLIFDCGGGTFDVTVLSIDDGIFEVKATGGNCHLGGSSFDSALVNHFATEFKRKHKKDLMDSPRALGRLKAAAERAKKALSSAAQTTVECDALYDGIDFQTSITRARFEELNMHFFRECMDCVEKVLRDAKMDKGSIDEIVMVGGSSRIPKIQAMLQEFFGGKELHKGVSPDEVVAGGSCIQSHIMTGGTDDAVKDLLLLDVCPLSLSIETAGGVATVLIPRNTTIPVSKTQTFSTYASLQTSIMVKIGEGERPVFSQNNLLGQFELSGIPPMERGKPVIEISYEISVDGMLQVSAVEKSTGKSNKIAIKNDKGRLSAEQIEQAIKDAEKFAEQDKKVRERIERKNELDNMIYSLKTSIVDSGKASPEDTEKAKKVMEAARNWLDDHGETATFEEMGDKIKEIQDTTTPILMELYKNGATPEGGVPNPMGDMPNGQAPPNDGDSNVKIDEVD